MEMILEGCMDNNKVSFDIEGTENSRKMTRIMLGLTNKTVS